MHLPPSCLRNVLVAAHARFPDFPENELRRKFGSGPGELEARACASGLQQTLGP